MNSDYRKFYMSILIFAIFIAICSCEESATDELMLPTQKLNKHKITFVDYASLPENSFPRLNKYFDDSNQARSFLPNWLSSKLSFIEDSSSVIITYDFFQERDASLSVFETRIKTIDSKNYSSLWGGIPYVESFTPSKAPETEIPNILKETENVQNGDVLLVEYNYSKDEPYIIPNNDIYYINEDFSTVNSDISNIGWDNRSANGYRKWITRIGRAFATANGVAEPAKIVLDTWLVTSEIDLSQATNPILSFDLAMGYYSGETFLSIYVIDAEDYDPNKNIVTSRWTEITDMFELPETGPAGYGTMNNYIANFKEFIGGKIRIAYRYQGKVNLELNTSSSYEIDNVVVHEIADQLVVSSTDKIYKAFQFDNGTWKIIDNNSIFVLQPDDYLFLNVKTIDRDKASLLIPKVLSRKSVSTANQIRVVYKDSKSTIYADDFSHINGAWRQITPLETINKSDEYVYDLNKDSWNYIETIQ